MRGESEKEWGRGKAELKELELGLEMISPPLLYPLPLLLLFFPQPPFHHFTDEFADYVAVSKFAPACTRPIQCWPSSYSDRQRVPSPELRLCLRVSD